METSKDTKFVDDQPLLFRKGNSVLDSSLIVGIILIALFLGLFVLEFSRILTLAGKVEHTLPGQPIPAAEAVNETL